MRSKQYTRFLNHCINSGHGWVCKKIKPPVVYGKEFLIRLVSYCGTASVMLCVSSLILIAISFDAVCHLKQLQIILNKNTNV